MFDTLSERLGGILDKLTKRGALSDSDVNDAMREVRRALIEADVALDVVRSFTDKVRHRAVGQDVVRWKRLWRPVGCVLRESQRTDPAAEWRRYRRLRDGITACAQW
jgi:signal recognition particle GTPase